jgi:hypothetical protein
VLLRQSHLLAALDIGHTQPQNRAASDTPRLLLQIPEHLSA